MDSKNNHSQLESSIIFISLTVFVEKESPEINKFNMELEMFAKTRLILHAHYLGKWKKTITEADGNRFYFAAIVSQ